MMARKKSADDAARFEFTRKLVDAAVCAPGKSQALFWDTKQGGLGLRVTPTGKRTFIFEGMLAGKNLRITIGPGDMQLQGAKDRQGRPVVIGARTEAARFATMIAQGIDPRAERAATIAAQARDRKVSKIERQRREVTGLDAWATYLDARRPHWGERNYVDHVKMAAAGGVARKRMPGKVTIPGPLRSLLDQPLASIDAKAVERWVTTETKTRPARAALGFRLLIVFFNWLAEHDEYRAIAKVDACTGKATRERVAKPSRKTDVVQREQLKPWFAEVRKLEPVPSAYLQTLLLTGARREELAAARWPDVDFKWKSLRIRDKVEGERVIPLTPYVGALLANLKMLNDRPPTVPRRLRANREAADEFLRSWEPSPWVFASARAKDGYLQEPRIAHNEALDAAGLPHVTLHGLRRSFGTLAEWVEVPVGIVAQIQGHKPSAIAEKHYRVRPLDLLRMWHERIEAWLLEQAGIEGPEAGAPRLSVVGSTER
ncbi:MAG: integrase family protein [Burkholderiaceae bacterium]